MMNAAVEVAVEVNDIGNIRVQGDCSSVFERARTLDIRLTTTSHAAESLQLIVRH